MIPLTTARLRLRLFDMGDVDAILAIHQSQQLRRFIPTQVLEDESEVPARVARFARFDDDPILGIVALERLGDGCVVGLVMAQPIPASAGVDLDDVEIGWRAHPEHSGQGYITEGAQAVLDHLLGSGLPRVVAVTRPDNRASQAVAERIGMRPAGTTTDYYDTSTTLFVAEAAQRHVKAVSQPRITPMPSYPVLLLLH